MKVFAINGSPRKHFNTAKMLNSFLEGASSVSDDVEVKMINLYDLNFKGCTECFACKRKNSDTYGRCSYPDDITELLSEISKADVIAFGSPVYFGDISGMLRCFIERLFYPFTAFKKDSERVIAPKKIRTAFIHTMNVAKEIAEHADYAGKLAGIHFWTQHVLGYAPQVLYAYNTYQYINPEQYVADIWDWDDKAKWREEQFPEDLKSAYNAGRDLTARCR